MGGYREIVNKKCISFLHPLCSWVLSVYIMDNNSYVSRTFFLHRLCSWEGDTSALHATTFGPALSFSNCHQFLSYLFFIWISRDKIDHYISCSVLIKVSISNFTEQFALFFFFSSFKWFKSCLVYPLPIPGQINWANAAYVLPRHGSFMEGGSLT